MNLRRPLGIALGLGMALWGGNPAQGVERLFGVVPQYSPRVLAEQWQPLLNRVNDTDNTELRFATAASVGVFEDRCLDGAYDYAYMSALTFMQTHRAQGYRLLVRQERPVVGVIVVGDRYSASGLAGLAGQAIAFPTRAAFGATLLTRAALDTRAVPYKPVYLGTHESVYRAVAQGQYPAGGGIAQTFDSQDAELRKRLRVLYRSAPVVAHVIAAHPRVPAAEAEQLRQTLIRLDSHDDAARQRGRFVAAGMEDMAPLQGLGLPSARGPRALTLHVPPRLQTTRTREQMLPLTRFIRQRLDVDVALVTYADAASYATALPGLPATAIAIVDSPPQRRRLESAGFRALVREQPVPGAGHSPPAIWLAGPAINSGLRAELTQLLLDYHVQAPGQAALAAGGVARLLAVDNPGGG